MVVAVAANIFQPLFSAKHYHGMLSHFSCVPTLYNPMDCSPLGSSVRGILHTRIPEWVANPMDGGAWWAAVPGVATSQTRLSDFTFTFYFHALEREMVTYSSVLAWRIPGMGEPGGLPSLGSHRVRHD